MLRRFLKVALFTLLTAGGGAALVIYHNQSSASRQIAQLEEQKQKLEQVVTSLRSEKRVADVLVTGKQLVDGIPQTTLLFVEYDKSNQPLPGRSFTVAGEQIHFDALVIKFERGFTEQNDPLRGHSLALFTRIYGDHETPEQGQTIDEPNSIPLVYQSANPQVRDFEMSLWRNFWRLADDPLFRNEHGVRVANGQGVFGPLAPDRLYTLTLESTGGLNLTSEPLKGIYREALQRK